MENHFYSTYIGDEKICLVLLAHDSYRVSDKLWVIGDGRMRKFFVRNASIKQQCQNPEGTQYKPVFWDNFVFESFAVGSIIREIVKGGFVVTQ
jgi:hypothetical protein